jgi:GNAT superfamily N-acetyltransferase
MRASMPASSRTSSFTFEPLTAARWRDVERLFGERGACGGCWCMAWRLPPKIWRAGKGAGNRNAFRRLVGRGPSPGLLAYHGGEPAGWCSFGPRASFPTLARSRVLAPVDERDVWSVSCFFVARPFRRRGLSAALLEAAAAHAARLGARVLEGYPLELQMEKMPDVFAWTGIASAFRRAGFTECARRSPLRPIMRRELTARRTASPAGRPARPRRPPRGAGTRRSRNRRAGSPPR